MSALLQVGACKVDMSGHVLSYNMMILAAGEWLKFCYSQTFEQGDDVEQPGRKAIEAHWQIDQLVLAGRKALWDTNWKLVNLMWGRDVSKGMLGPINLICC